MNRILILLLSLLSLSTTTYAATSATSFCKCICFNNSTIIALNPPKSTVAIHAPPSTSTSTPRGLPQDISPLHASLLSHSELHPARAAPHLTCASCNRAFCQSYNLPICASASESDIFTTCFQRDSVKDEAVVFIFIFATAGLLVWAVAKPFVLVWADRAGIRLGGSSRAGGATEDMGRYQVLNSDRGRESVEGEGVQDHGEGSSGFGPGRRTGA